MSDAQLYEESFQITQVLNKDYDRVARITATSHDASTQLVVDINSELYPLSAGDSFNLLLASTLNLDGSKDEGGGWRGNRVAEPTLADMWDYVCYGKVYRVEDPEEGTGIKFYISYGGLLMTLEGPYKKLSPLKVENLYLLLKK